MAADVSKTPSAMDNIVTLIEAKETEGSRLPQEAGQLT